LALVSFPEDFLGLSCVFLSLPLLFLAFIFLPQGFSCRFDVCLFDFCYLSLVFVIVDLPAGVFCFPYFPESFFDCVLFFYFQRVGQVLVFEFSFTG